MNTVKVNKTDLLLRLQHNKAEHLDQYEEAMEKYREALVAELEEKLAAAKRGEKVDHMLRLPIPASYANSFDTAIEMLQWEVAEEVELDQQDFARYVQNEWEWRNQFVASAGAYLS